MDLPQQSLITRVTDKCKSDARIVAALIYGSFAYGEPDTYSDIEFWLFIADDQLKQITPSDWLADIAPIHWSVTNESGATVAFFRDHLVREEFHFASESDLVQLRTWEGLRGKSETLDRLIVVDRTGELKKHLQALEGASPVPRRV